MICLQFIQNLSQNDGAIIAVIRNLDSEATIQSATYFHIWQLKQGLLEYVAID